MMTDPSKPDTSKGRDTVDAASLQQFKKNAEVHLYCDHAM